MGLLPNYFWDLKKFEPDRVLASFAYLFPEAAGIISD